MFHKNSNKVNQSKCSGPRPRANPSLPVTINLMELKDKLESAKVKVLEEEMRKLQLENERLAKCVEVYKKSIEAKNEEIENKNGIINKLLGKSLSLNDNSSFAQLQPKEHLPETKNLHRLSQNPVPKNVEDDIDIDGLLQANLDFDILDLSMSGSILNNDLPLALASTDLDVYGEFNDQEPLDKKSLGDEVQCYDNQIPNRDDSNGDRSPAARQDAALAAAGVKEDPNIIERLVSQSRNLASVQKKVSPLKIVLERENYKLHQRPRPRSPGGVDDQETFCKKRKIEEVKSSLHCPHCSLQFPLGGNWKLKKHIMNKHKVMSEHIEPRKTVTCDICGEDCGFEAVLKAHKKHHQDLYPWKCRKCGSTFENVKELVQHVKSYHGIYNADNASEVVNVPFASDN